MRILSILLIGIGFTVAVPLTVLAQNHDLTASIAFECLWWSSDQMIGLDPNRPPPKATKVRLEKWEYSDPVGVPHPESIDIVIEIDAGAEAVRKTMEVSVRWKVKKWLSSKIILKAPLELQRGEHKKVVVSVEIGPDIDRLKPSLLQANMTFGGLTVARSNLPVLVGD